MSERIRALRPLPAWIALLVSAAIHFQLMFFGLGLRGGALNAGGERGLMGAGDDQLEITVVGAEAPIVSEPSTHVAPPSTEAEQNAEPENRIERRRSSEPRTLTSPERARERAPHENQQATAMGGEAQSSVDASPDRAPSVTAGSDRERTGRASGDEVASAILGSVGLGGGQSSSRSLLERALTCDDPIAGVWVAHRYSPARRDWGRMTMRIEREGDELRGTITSRVWSGLPSDRRPLPCAFGRFDVTVRMPARGRIDGERFSFGASSYEVTRVDCPSPGFMYYPDSFRGRVDSLRDEMDALNNDGHVEFDAPYRFRRTSCGD